MQSVIPFSSTLDDLFMSRANTWRHTAPEDASVGGIDGWLNYVNGEDAQMSEQIYRELKAIKATQFDFDAIVYWGANDIFSNSRLARHLPGVVSVAMEFGPTRLPFEPTLAIDSHGVNGKSMWSQLTTSDVLKLKNTVPTWLRTQNAVTMANGRTLFQSRPGRLSNDLARRLDEFRGRCDRLVLFAHQLADDANSLMFANGHSTISAIERLCAHPAMDKGLVVLKPHPKVFNNAYNAKAWRDLEREIEKRFPQKVIIFHDDVEKVDYQGFLESFDAVVGINSSVIFEAALLERPVVAFGQTGFLPNDADTWLDEALGDWNGDGAAAARIAASLNIGYLLPPREIFKDKITFHAVIDAVASAYRRSAKDTLKALMTIQRERSPRERHLVHWSGPNVFNRKGIYAVPKLGDKVNVVSHRNGFIHPRIAITYDDAVGPNSFDGAIEAYSIDDAGLEMRMSAVTDLGEAPFAFVLKSGGRAIFARPTEERPARAKVQGFPARTKIGATMKVAFDSVEFPLYGGFTLYAAKANGSATSIEIPAALRTAVSKGLRGPDAPSDSGDGFIAVDAVSALPTDLPVTAIVDGGRAQAKNIANPALLNPGEVVLIDDSKSDQEDQNKSIAS